MDRLSSIFSSRFSRHLGHFVLALGVVVLVETVLGAIAPQSPLVDEFASKRLAIVAEPAPDIEILGDSVAYAGIDPDALATALGGQFSVKNRALPGSGPVFSYFLLRDQIAAGRVPKAIVWAHAPHTYSGTRFGVLVGRFCNWDELPVLAANGCAGDDLLFGVLNQLSYSLAYREQIRDAMRGDLSYFRRAGTIRRPPPGNGLTAVAGEALQGTVVAEPFRVSDLNREFTEKALAMASEHGIRVYLAAVPESATSYATREPVGYYDQYRAAFIELAATGGAQVLDESPIIYEDRYFADPTHLTGEGARLYTGDLAARLSVALDAAPEEASGRR